MARLKNEDLTARVFADTSPARKEIVALDSDIKKAKGDLVEMQKQLAFTEKISGKNSDAYREQKKAVDDLSKAIKSNQKTLKEKRDALKATELTMSELRSKIKDLSRELRDAVPGTSRWKELNEQLREHKTRLKELERQSNQTEGFLKRLWNSAAGGVAIVGVVYHTVVRAVQGIARLVGKMSEFEQANANLATILGKDVKEIEALTNSALDLGRTTEYTASQVTLLQTELAKLGFNENQILQMEEPILHFATAIGADLPEAAQLAGATLRTFNLQARDSEDVLGAMAVATNKSALNFSYLQTSMSIVGPVANTFGIDVKDTISLLGSLANAGFDASSAATATRNILLNLANANGKLAKEIGKPVKTFPELIEAMQELDAKGLDLAKTLELTDKRSVSAFNRFLTGADDANTLREALEDVDGELERIANDRMNTLEGSAKLFKSAWEGLILTFRNSTGPIKSVVDWLTRLINTLNDALDPAGKYRRQQDAIYKQMTDMYAGESEGAYRAKLQKMFDEALAEEQAAEEAARKSRKRRDSVAHAEAMQRRINIAEAMERALTDMRSGALDSPVIPGDDGSGGGDDDKKKRSWSLQNDQAFLEAKLELTRQYNAGEIKDQEAYNEKILDLEIASLTARLALRKESGTDRLQLEQQLLEKVHQQQENAKKKAEQLAKKEKEALKLIEDEAAAASGIEYNKKVLEEDRRYKEELAKFSGQKDALAAIERKHRRLMLQIDIEGYNELDQIEKSEYDLRRQEVESYYTEQIAQKRKGSADELALQRDMHQQLAKIDLEYLDKQRERLTKLIAAGLSGEIEFSEKQLMEFRKKLAETIKLINSVAESTKGENWKLSDGTGGGSLFGVSEAQWGQLFSNLKEGKLLADDLSNAFTALGGMAQEGFKIASQAIAMTNAKEQEELRAYQKANSEKQKDLQKRLDAGLMTQAQYDAEIEKMQAEQEAKEEEYSLRQAEREKSFNIVQAIINTALAVTKTLSAFPWPASIAPAAIVGAMGAAQIALMKATPVSGREDGGFFAADGRPVRVRRKQDGRSFPARLSPDRRGWIDSPTVLVGENGSEYVIPSDALQNPSVRPFVDAIETARRSGRLRDLRLEAVQPRLAVAGRAAGGFFADDSDASMGGGVTMPDGVRLSGAGAQELLQILRRLGVILSKPIKAEVNYLGHHGIKEAEDDYDRARGRGKLG